MCENFLLEKLGIAQIEKIFPQKLLAMQYFTATEITLIQL